ncbi:hypothetical protein FA15DRAFT_664079 [Coprinopsis marcescibilis]|uniref:Uncharacterized protein n=1 Tax=Coprinopsis marcescibilis TaxID=230819 RepID=A0A5C3L9U2_COPMA|nr:hypothetical protein FA15DRAFT_664079 [Coprinopsis marcescibilis]
MDALPIDTSHPAVRDYLSLVRLQVLTPLSLLINIACVLVCATVSTPSINGISKLHPTAISPNFGAIAAYVGVIFLGQIGYCILLVLAGKPETKKMLVKGVGFSLVFANVVMGLWAIAWVMQWFLVSTILQGVLLLLLLYSNVALLIYHPPDPSRWIDIALVHAPMRFFFVLPFALLFPLSLFITLHLTYSPPYPDGPQDYSKWHAWTGFGVVVGTNLAAFLVILLRKDIVWCVAATWICVSLWSQRPKPGPVYIPVIIFTVLHPLALLVSYAYAMFFKKNTARVQLPEDTDHPGLYSTPAQNVRTGGYGARPTDEERPAREIDGEQTWG